MNTNMNEFNPFVRGYDDFVIERKAMILRNGHSAPIYRPVHRLQRDFADDKFVPSLSLYCDQYFFQPALTLVPKEVLQDCYASAALVDMVYGVAGYQNGIRRHLAYAGSLESAHEMIRNISCDDTHYRRCWEISTAHLSGDGMKFIVDRQGESYGFFDILYSPGGATYTLSLKATPWTDEPLIHAHNMDAEMLRQQLIGRGVPKTLASLLMLAGAADTRILILNHDAPELPGLEKY